MSDEYDPLASVQAAGPPGTISFNYGLPDPGTFPADDLRRAMDRVLRDRPGLALQYGPEQGYGPLIDYVRDKIAREEDLSLQRPQIMLTGGSAQTLDHLCTLFTRPGDVALVEAPSYHQALQLLGDHGLRLVQVPTDNSGLQIEALAACLEGLSQPGGARPRFIYVIPNFQNPGGITLTTERRQALLKLAERHDLLVVEDDVYRDLAYEGDIPPSIFALDAGRHSPGPSSGGGQRVLRIGSFSKILAPGLRMGWFIGPTDKVAQVIDSGLRSIGGGANPLVANMLAEYCREGLLEPHIERLCQIYRERRDITLAALRAHMPQGVRWTEPGGGFFVWLTLPKPLRTSQVVAEARKAGLMVLAGDPFFAEVPTGQHLRLAFSYVTPEKIRRGIEVLGRVLRASI
jgi:DNA-binding transcriptional MocR family regulator